MQLGCTGSAYHGLRIRMDSAVRLGAFDIGGVQPINGHLYNVIPASGADEKPDSSPGYCRLYELGSTGSAYHRLHIRMDSAGRLCAFDIGGL